MKQVYEQDIAQYIEKTIRSEFGLARDFNFEFAHNFVMVDFYYHRPWNFWMFKRIQGMWNKLENGSSSFPVMDADNMYVDGSHITLRIYFDTDRKSVFN